MKTEYLVVRVEPEIAQALAHRKNETCVPTSEFVRRAIVQALQGPAPVEYRGVNADVADDARHAQTAQLLVAACKPLRKPEGN